MWNGPNKTTRTTTINNWRGKTYCYTYLSHLTRPTCWCRRWTRKLQQRLLCEEEGNRRIRCEMDQIKQQRNTTINNWQGKTYCCTCLSHLTQPTGWRRRWTRKHEERLLCLGGGSRKKKGQIWNGPNETTKDQNYQQLAGKDLLWYKDVTLDTSHWLMSALNEEASRKAVVFRRRKKKGTCKMWNGPNKTT